VLTPPPDDFDPGGNNLRAVALSIVCALAWAGAYLAAVAWLD